MSRKPLFFATLDPLRGLGIETKHDNFHIVCFDYTHVVDLLVQDGIRVFCLEKELAATTAVQRTTRDLLLHPKTLAYLEANSADTLQIAVFKPTFDIELVLGNTPLGQKRSIVGLNAPTALSKKLENKLQFFDLCNQNGIKHTPAQKAQLHHIPDTIFETLQADCIVVQFEQGWFGNKTFFINTPSELAALTEQYTDREVLVAPFISGTVLTNNLVVTESNTFQSYPFFQINDEPGHEVQLSRLRGSTIGNVWKSLESQFAEDTPTILSEIQKITDTIGTLLRKQGFHGYAGLDFIVSENNEVYVQELNPRFTASVQMFTLLEQAAIGTSLLEEHFGISNTSQPETYFQPLRGARIIARNTTSSAIQITERIPNGIYTLNADETYTFVRPSYCATDLKNDEFLLFTAGENRDISSDEEILQVQSLTIPPDTLITLARTIKKTLIS